MVPSVRVALEGSAYVLRAVLRGHAERADQRANPEPQAGRGLRSGSRSKASLPPLFIRGTAGRESTAEDAELAGTGGLADLGDLQDRGGGGQEERGDEGSPPS